MLIAIFTVFLQFQLASVYSETTTGKETLFTRVSDQLSWIAAREACNNMSFAFLPGMRAARALGKMQIGEFAWIDGKEYTFCYAKDVNETEEICRYVRVRREDTNENLTYICNKGPGQKVTQICIGIVKLDNDKFEFSTTSCDEIHTVICDDTSIKTALTLATRDEMMPRLGDSKAAIASKKRQNVDTMQIFFALGSIFGFISFLLVLGAIFSFAIMKYRKCRRQCQETLSRDNTTQGDAESVGYVIVL